jgi:hypothetical protein
MKSLSLAVAVLLVLGTVGCGSEDEGCLPGRTDCSGNCVNLQADPDHCGSCSSPCDGGQVCVAGSCEDLPDPPSQEDVEWATDWVQTGSSLADVARTILEMLGLLPVYECDEPRATFIGDIVNGFETEVSCATAATESLGADADAVTLTFPDTGCEVDGRMLAGLAVFSYAGSMDSMALEVDLTGLEVDGEALNATAGYGTCGDEKRFWASGTGSVPGVSGWSYALDVTVGMRAGIPVFGGTSLILNGTVDVENPDGTHQVTFEELEYELGDYLPKEGVLIIETASGRRIQARFSSNFLMGEAEITIDDHDPVTVPVL